MAITLDGSALTLLDVVRVSRGAPVAVDPAARDAVAATRDAADAVAGGREVYGRSTGVGANRGIVVDASAPGAGAGLLASHAVAAGPRRSPERVRALLAVRANQLLAGGSGADPAVVDGLVALLTDGPLPPVRELGGLGTGDLAALATVGLALIERGVEMTAGDALPLMSSNAASLADAALAVEALTALAGVALEVAALTFTAVDGNPEAFSPLVDRVTPFAGARFVAATLRTLVDGAVATPARIQDPYALRTMPQVHGPLLDALARASTTVTRLVNAPTENPVFDADGGIAHHGGFHAAYLGGALDAVRLALLGAARLSTARLALLVASPYTGLPPFLADPDAPGASGVLALEYVAGSALGDLQLLAAPTGTTTASVSHGAEEDASFAALAARAALDTVNAYRTVLATELLAALRALRMKGRPVPSRWATLVAELGTDLADRDLTADLDAVESHLRRAADAPDAPLG